jgi:hypothetical protein
VRCQNSFGATEAVTLLPTHYPTVSFTWYSRHSQTPSGPHRRRHRSFLCISFCNSRLRISFCNSRLRISFCNSRLRQNLILVSVFASHERYTHTVKRDLYWQLPVHRYRHCVRFLSAAVRAEAVHGANINNRSIWAQVQVSYRHARRTYCSELFRLICEPSTGWSRSPCAHRLRTSPECDMLAHAHFRPLFCPQVGCPRKPYSCSYMWTGTSESVCTSVEDV